MPYVDSETLPALAYASKTTHDTAVFRDVADSSFSLLPTTERHFIEFAENDVYNAYLQDLFASSTRSRVSPHLKWEEWFAKLDNISTLEGKVPMGVTAGVLHLLKYGSRVQLEALATLCNRDEGFDAAAVLLEEWKRSKKVLEKAYPASTGTEEEFSTGSWRWGACTRGWVIGVPWRPSRGRRMSLCTCFGKTAPRR